MSIVEDLITQDEGLKLKVYDDATGAPLNPGDTLVGHPTIGVGRALDTNGVSKDEAIFLLHNDIDRASFSAATNFPWFSDLSDSRKAVIISMIFNMGIAGFSRFHQMINHLENKRYELAALAMLDSSWAKQVKGRAVHLADMMRGDSEKV